MSGQPYSVEVLETAGLVDLMLLSPAGDTQSVGLFPADARALAAELLQAADDVEAV